MNIKTLFISFLLISTSILSFGQAELDSIILLNGRIYRGAIGEVNDNVLIFSETDKKGESFTNQIENYRVFSYTKQGKETIVYKQDEAQSNFLTIDEARNATLGSYDARQTFKPRFVFWSSLALGYGASLFDTYLLDKTVKHKDYEGDFESAGFFKSNPTFSPIVVPIVLTASWAIPSFRIKEKQMIQTHLKNNDSYYRGYHRIAKQKRMLAALRGSLIGIGAGMLTYGIFKP